MKSLRVKSHWGHYNFADPKEESCNIYLIFQNDVEQSRINFTLGNPSSEPGGYIDAEDAAELIDEWFKSILYSSSESKNREFKELILKHADEIYLGNMIAKKDDLISQKEKIEKEIQELEEKIIRQKEASYEKRTRRL